VAPLVETLIEYSLKQMSSTVDYTTICSNLTLLETIAASDAYQPILKTSGARRMTIVRKMLDQDQGFIIYLFQQIKISDYFIFALS